VAFVGCLVAEGGTEFGTAMGLLQIGVMEWLLVGIYWLRWELSLVQRRGYCKMGKWNGFWWVFSG
jgi:uncharacterized membrane protein YciS (DUF1049 family)